LVHRDVSPHNVLLSFSGDVKLADFGIAKATALAAETQAGVLKGKFAYMSPEQIRGADLDAASDVFSAGTLLHELICWQRLFRRESDFATIRAVERDPIAPPSALREDVPDALERVVMRALERDRSRRYQTAQQMQLDLESVVSDMGWRCGPIELASFLATIFADKVGPRSAVSAGRALPRRSTPPTAQAERRQPALRAQPSSPAQAQPSRPAIAPPAAGNAEAAPGRWELHGVPEEEAPPTIIQPPDFDDVVNPAAGAAPVASPGDARQNADSGRDSMGAPKTIVVEDGQYISESAEYPAEHSFGELPEPLLEDVSLGAELHSAPLGSPIAGPGELAPREMVPARTDQWLEVILVVGIVLCLSLAVAIVVVIAVMHAGPG
jgi:hypothetical protein